MSVVYLHLSYNWMGNQNACSGFADKPVPSYDVDRGAIDRVGVNRRADDWKTRQYDKARAQSTANEFL